MERSIIVGLIQNIAILLSLSMLYDQVWMKKNKTVGFLPKILTGILLGILGVILILTPWHLVPGIFFDTRSVMLSISGLFFGTIPTIIAMAITASYRIFVGGDGYIMGLAVILSSGTIGMLWKNIRPGWTKHYLAELLTMGILVHIAMICCTWFLPQNLRWETFKNIALPVIITYPIASVLLGKLFLNYERNKKTIAALDLSEERWHFALEGAGDGVFDTNFSTSEVFFSKQWKNILGYNDDEIENSSEEWEKRIHPDDKEMVLELLEQHIKGKTSVYLAEYRMKCKNGHYKWILARGKVTQRDENGKAIRIIGTHTDVTERKQTQEEINKISLHYQALIEKASDGIVLIDNEKKLKYKSPSANRIFGYPQNDRNNLDLISQTHPDDLPLVVDTIQELIQFPLKTPTIQYRLRNKAGNWQWIESTFRNLLLDPSVEAIVINFRDITESKKAEEEIKKLNEILEQKVHDRTVELEKKQEELVNNQIALLNLVEDLNSKSVELQKSAELLEAANKELEAFTYSVSHDLRSPLRAINGFVNIIMEEYALNFDAEGKRICGIIQSNATKMGQLIDDLLAFSRLIKNDMHSSKIDMNELVKNVISDFETNTDLSRKQISINKLPDAFGDRNMMKQVWINLISNAIKYTSKTENAQITIGTCLQNDETIYYIKDNGVGFSMTYAHKLFGVFQRLHSSTEFEGTGVGLAIVQRIINRHKGQVWAESEIGKGANFYFKLPNS